MADPYLFAESELPQRDVPLHRDFLSLKHPLWTENKAKLIQEYLRLFTYVTKHGTYIDGFAAPQRRDRGDLCSARLVLENQPKWVRDLWLCDIDSAGGDFLERLAHEHAEKGRRINVVRGDFNTTIQDILGTGRITEKTATFALLDQRTFECEWSTVARLASHKSGTKIELFYFFASGWIDRAIAAVRRPETIAQAEAWWGRPDWTALKGLNGIVRAKLLADRFRQELGYRFAYPYAIHQRSRQGRTMYHMVHATDHPAAPELMLRAYRKVSGRPDLDPVADQSDFEALWKASQDQE